MSNKIIIILDLAKFLDISIKSFFHIENNCDFNFQNNLGKFYYKNKTIVIILIIKPFLMQTIFLEKKLCVKYILKKYL